MFPPTEQKEILMIALRAGASAFPVVGQLFNDLLDFRSKIKQERLNNFLESLAKYLAENSEVKLDAFKEEQFTDLFESVIRRVVQTKSKEKQERFQKIIFNSIENPYNDYDNAEIFLELVTTLSEIQIIILSNHYLKDHKTIELNIENNTLNEKKNKTEEDVKKLEILSRELKELQHYHQAHFYNIADDEMKFFNQSLYSAGLLVDNGFGSTWIEPFTSMQITEFGKKFYEFLKD